MKVPNHVAMILDGNGRWAQERNKPRIYGHEIGLQKIDKIATHAQKLGIKYLSVYCFSTENWNRPKEEVNFLMNLPSIMFDANKIDFYNKNNIKVVWIGRQNKMPQYTIDALENVVESTSANNGLVLTILMDYGTKWEIDLTLKERKVTSYDELMQNIPTSDLPNVDLLIRTGGEIRLSNFLLLKLSYAELLFIKTLWPDFEPENLTHAIEEFGLRDRRFGGLNHE